MGRFGTGFPAGRRRRLFTSRPTLPPQPPIDAIAPSAMWDGTAASGFTAAPSDPTRLTAKPALRLISPPNQAYTEELLLGVYAGANDGGTMLNNMGLSHVRVHYEGSIVDITEPSRQSFPDANGNQVSYFGWWIRLEHSGVNGIAQVYFEAVPSDKAMQSRVIGPFNFFPATSLHDLELEVAPSQAQVTGVRYPTLRAARDYCRSIGADRPRITISEPGDIVFGDTMAAYVGEGYITYEASAPVRITLDPVAVASGTRAHARFRSKYGRQHFRGANITLDFSHALEVYNESGLGSPPDWYDGVTLENPQGRYDLWRGYPRSRKLSSLCRGLPYFTECVFTNLPFNVTNASLARGCTMTGGYQEIATGSDCIISNVVTDFDSGEFVAPIDALLVSYTGGGGSASLSCSGNWGSSSRTFTAKVDGVAVDNFTVYDDDAAFHQATNYSVSNVAEWLNSIDGFSATVLDDSRFGTALSIPGGNAGAFTDVDVTGAGFIFVTEFDIHADLYQVTHAGKENGVLADNLGTGLVAQSLFMKDGPSTDFLVVNNVFENSDTAQYFSQLGEDHSHVVIAHNSWATQDLWLRVGSLAYNPDSYCLLANNTMPRAEWLDGTDADLTISGNHFQAGAIAPEGATGSSFGGNETTLFANAASGDFAPRGDLQTNLKVPVIRFDRRGLDRGQMAPAGALT